MRTKRTAGFSLVEMLGAVTILAVALLGVISTIVTVMSLNEDTRGRTLALTSAQRMMEQVQSNVHHEIPTLFASPNDTFDVPGLTPQDGSSTVGSIAVDATDAGLYVVTITVAWKGKTGNRSFSLARRLVDERGGLAWGAEPKSKWVTADDASEEAAPSSAAGSGGKK